MKCTVLHALRDHPGVWLSPTSALTARLIAGPVSAFMRQMETSEPEDELPVLLPGEDGPAALWIGNGSAGHRLAPAADLYGWREALEIATTPADLGGALLLWSLDDVAQLAGLGLLDRPSPSSSPRRRKRRRPRNGPRPTAASPSLFSPPALKPRPNTPQLARNASRNVPQKSRLWRNYDPC